MECKVVRMDEWLRSPQSIRSLDRQINLLLQQLSELQEARESTLAGMENLLTQCLENRLSLTSPIVRDALQAAAESLYLEDQQETIIEEFDDFVTLLEKVDELIALKEKLIHQKRLETARIKWEFLKGRIPSYEPANQR